jgi:hypothetical protein
MKHIFVRPALQRDSETCAKWAVQNLDRNKIDPKVIEYPSTFTLAAYDSEDGVILFMPVQTPLMMESVCVNPKVSERKQALALKEIVQALVTSCHLQGRGEVYFLGSDERTSAFAESQLFEKVDVPVYRVRISDLEKQNEGL